MPSTNLEQPSLLDLSTVVNLGDNSIAEFNHAGDQFLRLNALITFEACSIKDLTVTNGVF